jgi:hypothetical protein
LYLISYLTLTAQKVPNVCIVLVDLWLAQITNPLPSLTCC